MWKSACLILYVCVSISTTEPSAETSEVNKETARLIQIPDFDIGPYTFYPRNWAYQFLNLFFEWVAFLVQEIIIQLV